MPKYQDGSQIPRDQGEDKGDLGARERLRRFLQEPEHADELDELARGLDDSLTAGEPGRDGVADVLAAGAEGAQPAVAPGAPPQWPEEWNRPGQAREKPGPASAPGADPPPWPEEWSRKAGVRAVTPMKPAGHPEPEAMAGDAAEALPEQAVAESTPGSAASPAESTDPPPWPEEWDAAAKRALGAGGGKKRRQQKRAPEPAPPEANPPKSGQPRPEKILWKIFLPG